MTRALPRLLGRLLRVALPPDHAADLVADLADDYRVHAARPRLARAWWLARESTSLVWAYGRARAWSAVAGWCPSTRDVSVVARGWRRAPFHAAALSVVIGLSAAAALIVAGLASALVFRPLSQAHGLALRRIVAVDVKGREGSRLSFPELTAIRQQMTGVARLAALNLQPVVLRIGRTDVQTVAEVVDDAYFDLLRPPIVWGRALIARDHAAGAAPLVVISDVVWRRSFGADPDIVGREVALNGTSFTVVGVAAPTSGAGLMGPSVDAWVSIAHADAILSRGWRTDPGARWFTAFLVPAVSVAEVESRLDVVALELERTSPELWRGRTLRTEAGWALSRGQRAGAATFVGILAVLAALILCTGATNVAAMQMAAAVEAREQTRIHLSLGARRSALVRRHVLEGVALGTVGGAIAIGIYTWARVGVAELALLPTLNVRLDLPLTASWIATSLLATGAAGGALAVGPALWAVASGAPLGAAITGRAVGSRTRSGVRRWLVAAQLAASTCLIVGASLAGQSLTALGTVDAGFDRAGLVAMDFDFEPPTMGDGASAMLARDVVQRAAGIAGVVSAAMADRAPIDQSTPSIEVRIDAGEEPIGDVSASLVTATYFDTVGLPLEHGRAFTARESEEAAGVVIVNRSLATRLWPDGDAVGRALVVGSDRTRVTVVGVARDSKYRFLSDSGRLHVYRPTPPTLGLTLLARATTDSRATLGALQQAFDEMGSGIVGFFPRTMDDHLAIQLLATRAAAWVASALGLLALALATVGVYGLAAWIVAARRAEIGLRRAIGATTSDVVQLVARHALSTIVPGVAVGLPLAIGLATLMRGSLYGVTPFDPRSVLLALGALTIVATVACWLPSLRAIRIDPAQALRER
jgi:predicted permease